MTDSVIKHIPPWIRIGPNPAIEYPSPSYADAIGYTALKTEFGQDVPTGEGIIVAISEEIRSNTWKLQATGELAGKTIIYSPDNESGFSTHAYEVGQYFIGSNALAFGVSEVRSYSSSSWGSPLRVGSSVFPNDSVWKVENHSWGAEFESPGEGLDANTVARMDFRAYYYNILAVSGLNNSTGTMFRQLGNSYNGIIVGRTSGVHNRGGTAMTTHNFIAGRIKPDLVAINAFTSYNIPVVSAACILLLQKAEETPALNAATRTVVIKSLIMAGARKEPFAGWSNTTTAPIDSIFGAGQLNIYNSFKILTDGRHDPASHTNRIRGWDTRFLSNASNTQLYPLTVTETSDLCVSLNWFEMFMPTASGETWVANPLEPTLHKPLELRLWSLDGNGEKVAVIASSLSLIDNLQHIWTTGLAAGDYGLEVTGSDLTYPETPYTPTEGVEYALSWRLAA